MHWDVILLGWGMMVVVVIAMVLALVGSGVIQVTVIREEKPKDDAEREEKDREGVSGADGVEGDG